MPTRIREHGTEVTWPKDGFERIAAIRRIVERKQYAKIDGCMIDVFSASAILKVYDNLTKEESKEKYRNFKAATMANVAFRLMN